MKIVFAFIFALVAISATAFRIKARQDTTEEPAGLANGDTWEAPDYAKDIQQTRSDCQVANQEAYGECLSGAISSAGWDMEIFSGCQTAYAEGDNTCNNDYQTAYAALAFANPE